MRVRVKGVIVKKIGSTKELERNGKRVRERKRKNG